MSLEGFQSAIADLVGDPQKCLALMADGDLASYDLSLREARRLRDMVAHPGMSQNCALYRANRLTPIARSLPRTCLGLGERLLGELQVFWAMAPDSELQFKREAERFGAFLLRRIQSGRLAGSIEADLVLAELAELGVSFGSGVHP